MHFSTLQPSIPHFPKLKIVVSWTTVIFLLILLVLFLFSSTVLANIGDNNVRGWRFLQYYGSSFHKISPSTGGAHDHTIINKNSDGNYESSNVQTQHTTFPEERYGHSAITASDGCIYNTHGYMNHVVLGPVWMSDTWRLCPRKREWEKVYDPTLCFTDVATSVSKLSVPSTTAARIREVNYAKCGPPPRFGASLVEYDNYLYLFGGDDGGRRQLTASYTTVYFDDLWRLSLKTLLWESLPMTGFTGRLSLPVFARVDASDLASRPTSAEQSLKLSSNAIGGLVGERVEGIPLLHDHVAIVIGDNFVVHGGMTPDPDSQGGSVCSSNTYVMNLRTTTWRKLTTNSHSGTLPEGRYGHVAAWREANWLGEQPTNSVKSEDNMKKIDDGHLYIHGGFCFQHDKKDNMSEDRTNKNDVWRLKVDFINGVGEWEAVHAPSAKSVYVPTPRGYHKSATIGGDWYIFGGARCDPGCVCLGDLWRYEFSSHEWYLLSEGVSKSDVASDVRDPLSHEFPLYRYKHAMVAAESSANFNVYALYIFAGEAYSPHAYLNDVWSFELSPADHDRSLSIPKPPVWKAPSSLPVGNRNAWYSSLPLDNIVPVATVIASLLMLGILLFFVRKSRDKASRRQRYGDSEWLEPWAGQQVLSNDGRVRSRSPAQRHTHTRDSKDENWDYNSIRAPVSPSTRHGMSAFGSATPKLRID